MDIVEIRIALQPDGTVRYVPLRDPEGDYDEQPMSPEDAFRHMREGVSCVVAAPDPEDNHSHLETIPAVTMTRV